MNKIHPEAREKLRGWPSDTGGISLLGIISEMLHERDALRAQVAEMREALHELSFSSKSLISAIDQYIALPNAISGDSLNGWRNRVNRAEHSANEILSKDNSND